MPDVGNPNQRLEELGLVKVSEGVLNGNIHTSSHSMSNKTTFPKRDTTLVDVQGNLCSTFCHDEANRVKPDSTSCEALYEDIKSEQGTFTVEPSTSPSLPQDYDTKLTDVRDRQILLSR